MGLTNIWLKVVSEGYSELSFPLDVLYTRLGVAQFVELSKSFGGSAYYIPAKLPKQGVSGLSADLRGIARLLGHDLFLDVFNMLSGRELYIPILQKLCVQSLFRCVCASFREGKGIPRLATLYGLSELTVRAKLKENGLL